MTPAKPPINENSAPPRRWLQFRLRTLMLAMLILPMGLGWLAQARSNSQKAWDNVEEIQVNCYGLAGINRPAGIWWQRALGIDLPPDVSELAISLPSRNEHAQFQLLTRLQAFKHLRGLEIQDPCRTAHALDPLAHFQELEELTLVEGQFNSLEDDLSVIARLPKLKSFHDFGGEAKLSPKAFEVLASMASLEELSFTGNDCYEKLSKLQNLRRLNISCLNSTWLWSSSSGLGNLAEADNTIARIAKLEKLESLKLDQTDCSDGGVKHLTQLKNLRHLTIESDHLTDACLATLAELPSLTTLELKGKNITQEAVDQWKAKRPGLTITLL